MARRHAIAALALLSGCSMIERAPERVVVMTSVTRFSSGEPGEKLPPGWRAWTVGKYKKATEDRLVASQMKALTGYEMPYATLMYIWENRAPVSTIITNQYTTRVKMIVAESGNDRLGEWREEVRNVYEDYKRAFDEEPALTRSV